MTCSDTSLNRLPIATYRLQFNRSFGFRDAGKLSEYLAMLGVTDIYSSPLLQASENSLHGYDVVDHEHLNTELGTLAEFREFADRLKELRMGLIMDIVPNHMSVKGSANRWWMDVLENGPSSPYARFFDIDWHPPNANLENKVLLPILGEQYGRILESQQLKLGYRGGSFFVAYYETRLPISPKSSRRIIELVLAELRKVLSESSDEYVELESISTAFANLPSRTETEPSRIRIRRRETLVSRRRLWRLIKSVPEVRHALHEALQKANGTASDPSSFNFLEQLLSEQAYRLSHWKVAADEINYRRFFDVNELAAVRIEEGPVFSAVHEIALRLIRQGIVTGLRIDHVDGLLDPQDYLEHLQEETAKRVPESKPFDDSEYAASSDAGERALKRFYVVVEKILDAEESLPARWPVCGTTGYEFANLLNGVFIEEGGLGRIKENYKALSGLGRYVDVVYESKKLILDAAMSSELTVLSRKLDRISEQHRWSRDFTLNGLQSALAEVIACFPVYRTYIRQFGSVGAEDKLHIDAAIRAAKQRNPTTSRSVFDFIRSVLLLEDEIGLNPEQRSERLEFVMRFQQLTSPITAKGIEDTAFYRYYPLASLNEVGGNPDGTATTLERFHAKNRERSEKWPATLLATSTHDTKRGEDVRARLNALSEISEEWMRAVSDWGMMNAVHKTDLDGRQAPDTNEEYLIYQTLAGAWPPEGVRSESKQEFLSRVCEYINKALKEAKVHTSWINPDPDYDDAVSKFISSILEDKEFLHSFDLFLDQISLPGAWNSVSQTVLKLCVPGVPDIYQGSESWNFSLVDPDNRRPVDFESLKTSLNFIAGKPESDLPLLIDGLRDSIMDGRLKLYATYRLLNFRRREANLFLNGDYLPLVSSGPLNSSVVAFARRQGDVECIVAAGRFFSKMLGQRPSSPVGNRIWEGNILTLSRDSAGRAYRDVLSGKKITVSASGGGGTIRLSELFEVLPFAVLERVA
jgi:(1->4)-alpha-D-glucan 1-alpha-D-glucosylmutase